MGNQSTSHATITRL
jgi:uncharacterized protein YoxC